MWQSAFKILLSGNNVTRILGGLETTIVISLTSIVLGTLIGIVLGSLWTLSGKWVRLVFKIYLEIFRIIPTIPLLFLFYYILPRDLGVNLPAVQVSILVFALWFAAEFFGYYTWIYSICSETTERKCLCPWFINFSNFSLCFNSSGTFDCIISFY